MAAHLRGDQTVDNPDSSPASNELVGQVVLVRRRRSGTCFQLRNVTQFTKRKAQKDRGRRALPSADGIGLHKLRKSWTNEGAR
jgi:hypothetical protein